MAARFRSETKKMTQNYIITAIVLLISSSAFVFLESGCAQSLPGEKSAMPLNVRVHHVIDGDSVMFSSGGKLIEVRLWGIDAPEFDQPGADAAEKKLESLLRCKSIELQGKDRDRYGRTVGTVECDGSSVNEALVASGNAWVHVYYCKEKVCLEWKKLESKARKNNLGLWKWKNPVEPWRWKSTRK